MKPAILQKIRALSLLKLVRASLWLARSTNHYSGPHMRVAKWMVDAVERLYGIEPRP